MSKIKKNKKKLEGFTLIELLMVIAIIGILSSIVLVNLSSARMKAKNARTEEEMDALTTAIHEYYIMEGVSPHNPANTIDGHAYGCNVGEDYEGSAYSKGGVCLQELVDKGYIKTLPQYNGTDNDNIWYYDYGSYVTVGTSLNPQQYGPFEHGWCCAANESNCSVSGTEEYCMGFMEE